jgi:hypothetical protein
MVMMVMVMGMVMVCGGIRWGCSVEEVCRPMKGG